MENERYLDHISQGITLMASGNYPAAKKEFEDAIQIDRQSYEAYIHLGNACANLNEYDSAIDAFKNALVVNPISGEALYSIGNIYLLKDDKLKAVEFYNKAEDAGFKTAELYQMLAMIFFEADDTIQALKNINRAILASPLDGDYRLFKARIYLSENKYEEALETLDEMCKVLPDAFEAYSLRAQIYSAKGQYDDALRICDDGVKRFPEDPNLTIAKLKVLVEMQDDVKASEFIANMRNKGLYSKVLKEATIQESIVLLRSAKVEDTIKLLKESNQELAGDIDIVYLLLDVFAKSEKYEEVIEYSENLLKMDPGVFYEATAKYFHAHALDKLGRIDEAKKEYKNLTSEIRKLTIANPSFYEGYIYRLMCHTRIGEFDKALELADYIGELHPDLADSHAFRYFIYKEKGDAENAEIEKKAALSIKPDMVL